MVAIVSFSAQYSKATMIKTSNGLKVSPWTISPVIVSSCTVIVDKTADSFISVSVWFVSGGKTIEIV